MKNKSYYGKKKKIRIVAKRFSETDINNIELLIDNMSFILFFVKGGKGFTQSAFLSIFCAPLLADLFPNAYKGS